MGKWDSRKMGMGVGMESGNGNPNRNLYDLIHQVNFYLAIKVYRTV